MTKYSVSLELQQRINNKIAACLQVANQKFNRTFPMPKVAYDCRGLKAGVAKLQLYSVHFNPIFLNENVEEMIENTVPHELAHLIDWEVYQKHQQYYGRRMSAHGHTWKSIMRLFGATPTRCHSYNTSNAQERVKNKFHYKCSACGHDIFMGPVRHRKAQNGTTYWGKCCRQSGPDYPIVFQKKMGQLTYQQAREAVK